MRSDRGKRALDALKSQHMPAVLEVVARTSDEGRSLSLLKALSDPFADALCVVMYAGRDEFTEGKPYDEADVENQFSSWWDYLLMDGEAFAREQMAEKAPLGEYLRRGAFMFHID